MTMTILMTALTTAFPPPPGAVANNPTPREAIGTVERIWQFDGFYRLPPTVARVRLEGHLAGFGWRKERVVELGKPGQSTILTWTNSTERLVATLTRQGPMKTDVQYRSEKKKGAKR